MNIFRKLLDEASKLEEVASSIQREQEVGLSRTEIQKLVENYHSWYGESLAALPDDLKEKFRQEYEGTGKLFSLPKIRKFLAAPTEVSIFAVPNQKESKIPYWNYTYASTFSEPLLVQKQILVEAEKRHLNSSISIKYDAVAVVERLAKEFHSVVVQLNRRYNGRAGFQIKDEYDVQDLFHALLTPFFKDIRREESAPSHAGTNPRLDFLLKEEQIVIEIKKTREGLDGRKIGQELTIDKAYYRSHPDCKVLIAFVYDPDRYIINPHSLEKDLVDLNSSLFLRVVINQA